MATEGFTFHVVEVRLTDGQERFVSNLAAKHAKSKEVVLQRLLNVGIVVMYERMKIESPSKPKG